MCSINIGFRNHSTERNRIHQVGFLECYKTNTHQRLQV
ncbi:hypothetical protein LEP1GSC116_4422 [Leptospira interrogans serovar Icterohaemorrhagiae str. Verdun HP]|uniref:Uncharacterized protein n=4 Tax=Leptospira interrogans TaxID=173 RepID=M3GU86_LEPIR|nr:hypothetical protein LEP1GSC151_2278 [Leptospira interrogans serovar Grippotyphosa str. LT2186]EMG19186.1 hypothetical protein LEP1GSC150_0540 [Leptospira interrogans serovar Copenhageni str. LT2050]EMN28271.1 hypothetical protein LEP1GSC083_4938 [Leptospira interrogans serovar Pyrogenes str. L0374]EMO03552.1 hypothetical protein LEP1GSC116_4422 [Leptospira interrogans serovar Icterohaemorrhagiae str. Verdun HP]